MKESQAEKDYRRHETIKQAVISADRIIMDSSDGSEKDTNYLTASVAMELMRIAFFPFGLGIVFHKPGLLPKRNTIYKAVDMARSVVKNSPFISEEEANYLIAEVAKEFANKSLRPFQVEMLRKDLVSRFEEGESHGKTETADPGDR
ncbi:MAG: hypothetical protein E4H47_00090 [Parcubacteria group bacterium]|nr:MAG: hypothetical protein E4H47_00090 [Parcubacteria group bacterium]